MRTRLLALIALAAVGNLKADTLSYTTTPNGSGMFLYQFTLTNSGSAGGTLFDLFLSVPLDISLIDTGTIGTPVGWGDSTGGLLFFGPDVNPSTSFIQWSADFSGLYDVDVSKSLSGFSILTSQQVSSPLTFALNGDTNFAPAQAVSGVPEPSTFVLLLPVLVALAFRTKFRRMRLSPISRW